MYVVFWRQAFVRDPVSYCLFPVIVVPNVINYKKKNLKKEIQVKMLPHVRAFQVCRAYYCLFVYGDTSQKSELMFYSCFGLNSCNIFATCSSVSMHRVVTTFIKYL